MSSAARVMSARLRITAGMLRIQTSKVALKNVCLCTVRTTALDSGGRVLTTKIQHTMTSNRTDCTARADWLSQTTSRQINIQLGARQQIISPI